MPRHAFRPSGTGCWVLLKCSQFKTCVFESNLEFIFSSCGKYLYQSCLSMTIWVHSYDHTRQYKQKQALFLCILKPGGLQRPREWCHRKTILSIEDGSLHRSCSCLNDCEMHVWWNWGLCTKPAVCSYNTNPNLRTWSSDSSQWYKRSGCTPM